MITRKPHGVVSGVELCSYQAGRVYEIEHPLAEYLVVEGFALVEMRGARRSARLRLTDRRARLNADQLVAEASRRFQGGGRPAKPRDS